MVVMEGVATKGGVATINHQRPSRAFVPVSGGFQGEMPCAPCASETAAADLDSKEVPGAERFPVDQHGRCQGQYATDRLHQ